MSIFSRKQGRFCDARAWLIPDMHPLSETWGYKEASGVTESKPWWEGVVAMYNLYIDESFNKQAVGRYSLWSELFLSPHQLNLRKLFAFTPQWEVKQRHVKTSLQSTSSGLISWTRVLPPADTEVTLSQRLCAAPSFSDVFHTSRGFSADAFSRAAIAVGFDVTLTVQPPETSAYGNTLPQCTLVVKPEGSHDTVAP